MVLAEHILASVVQQMGVTERDMLSIQQQWLVNVD
jgi:hypothetical protein